MFVFFCVMIIIFIWILFCFIIKVDFLGYKYIGLVVMLKLYVKKIILLIFKYVM